MPRRTIEGTPQQWAIVGPRVRARRLALSLPQGPRPSNGVWSGVENGRPLNYRITEESERQMCEVLLWEPGSIQKMLNGEEPVEIAPPQTEVMEEITALRGVVSEVLRQLAELRHQFDSTLGPPADGEH